MKLSGITTLVLVLFLGGFVSAEATSAVQTVTGTVVRFNKAVEAVAADATHQFAEPVPATLELKVSNKRLTVILDDKTTVTDKTNNPIKAESIKYGQTVTVAYNDGSDKIAVSIVVQ